MVVIERWLPVVGWEGSYEVSDFGRVRSLDRIRRDGQRMKGRVLKPGRMGRRGYPLVVLAVDGRKSSRLVHQLVLEAFVGPCPAGMECLHWNDEADDARLENLRWGTRSENLHDSVRNGRHPGPLKSECPAGHRYTPENTKRNRNGRSCRACSNEQRRERRRAS